MHEVSIKAYGVGYNIVGKSVQNRRVVDPVEPVDHPCGYPLWRSPARYYCYGVILLVDSFNTTALTVSARLRRNLARLEIASA